ncbi:MAG: hypothetical protein KGL39_07460 [Patescibacteria group bacterium]|nr:hypothetical protein [Patescibacteria group bacterium]
MIIENCPECGGTHIGSYECPYTPEEARAHMERQRHDPRDSRPASEMVGRAEVFRDHNCARCDSGLKPCVRGNPRSCDWLHARND